MRKIKKYQCQPPLYLEATMQQWLSMTEQQNIANFSVMLQKYYSEGKNIQIMEKHLWHYPLK